MSPQRTLEKPVTFSGIGIHTAEVVSMRFVPADPGSGIHFQRVDLPGKPLIKASLENVIDTSRCTTLGNKELKIHTVEHVLAAVAAHNIDNLVIEISNIEPPVAEGSSKAFCKMIEQAGIREQKESSSVATLKEPIYYTDDSVSIVALPHPTYKISYTLNYPSSAVLNCQFVSLDIDENTFREQIAPCRTFSLYEEVSALMDRGLIKGGSLSNAVIIKDDVVFSKEGLYFPDEMARHKVLDMVGDMSLIGKKFSVHILAIRAGHASNFAFAKKLTKALKMENS